MATSRIKGYGVTGFAATSSSVTASTTAGTSGDIHVAQLLVTTDAANVTAPSGWTQISTKHDIDGGPSSGEPQATYWWWKDDGSTTSAQWSWSTGNQDRSVWVEVIRGCDGTTPVQTTSFKQSTSAGTATSNSGVTLTADGAVLLYVSNDGGQIASNTPTNYTRQNNTLDQAVYTRVALTSGHTTGTLSVTIGGSADWISDIIALQVPLAAVVTHQSLMTMGVGS